MSDMSVRRCLFNIIQPDRGDSRCSRLFDWIITVLILVSVVTAFAVTFDQPGTLVGVLFVVEQTVSVIFTVEYLLRILTADFLYPGKGPFAARVRYVFSPMAVIDLLAIPTGIVTAGLTARLETRKDRDQDSELARQRQKDDEHDKLLREQGELLKEISEKLSKLSSW